MSQRYDEIFRNDRNIHGLMVGGFWEECSDDWSRPKTRTTRLNGKKTRNRGVSKSSRKSHSSQRRHLIERIADLEIDNTPTFWGMKRTLVLRFHLKMEVIERQFRDDLRYSWVCRLGNKTLEVHETGNDFIAYLADKNGKRIFGASQTNKNPNLAIARLLGKKIWAHRADVSYSAYDGFKRIYFEFVGKESKTKKPRSNTLLMKFGKDFRTII